MMNQLPTEEELEKLAAAKYPGRTWAQLSKEEREALFAEARDRAGEFLAASGQRMMEGAGKKIGNIYVNNPWESFAGGLMSGYGAGRMNKARKQRELGRKAAGDLGTYSDAVLQEQRERERRRREEERLKLLAAMGAY